MSLRHLARVGVVTFRWQLFQGFHELLSDKQNNNSSCYGSVIATPHYCRVVVVFFRMSVIEESLQKGTVLMIDQIFTARYCVEISNQNRKYCHEIGMVQDVVIKNNGICNKFEETTTLKDFFHKSPWIIMTRQLNVWCRSFQRNAVSRPPDREGKIRSTLRTNVNRVQHSPDGTISATKFQ